MNLAQSLEDKLKLVDSYKHIFQGKNQEAGDRVLRHLLKTCGLLKPEILTDANALLVRQGQQHIVLSILKILNKNPNEIVKQIQESMNENENT